MCQIAFAACFYLQELFVESIRYFHDDDEVSDPILDDVVQSVPNRLFDDIGYFVLPARCTWEFPNDYSYTIINRLSELDSTAKSSKRDGGTIPNWLSDVTNESERVRSNRKLSEFRRFLSNRGGSEFYFGMLDSEMAAESIFALMQ